MVLSVLLLSIHHHVNAPTVVNLIKPPIMLNFYAIKERLTNQYSAFTWRNIHMRTVHLWRLAVTMTNNIQGHFTLSIRQMMIIGLFRLAISLMIIEKAQLAAWTQQSWAQLHHKFLSLKKPSTLLSKNGYAYLKMIIIHSFASKMTMTTIKFVVVIKDAITSKNIWRTLDSKLMAKPLF